MPEQIPDAFRSIARPVFGDGGRHDRSVLDDPLDRDRPDDAVVVTSRRGLVRVAMIAAETGSRFVREDVPGDAFDWMTTPRRIFGGSSAVEACLERRACLRALVLHGTGLGLDADPDVADSLIDDDDGDDPAEIEGGERNRIVPLHVSRGGDRPRLYTSILVHEDDGGMLYGFGATVASSTAEAVARLAARHGPAVARRADFREGFDASEPMVEALVSPAVAHMLVQVAADPASPLARGLEIAIEQRFAS